ncbi:unnamed protein product [Fraxinus pennsylvanica]|uniref:DUF632 domain-containing protein n=1 Tax=Fraxinus pennsylvanica TaxID=56036 RepID=A0AAD1ZL68_9LAMI|nr:unnamed protein product [Fraxinus pennsylvanica]
MELLEALKDTEDHFVRAYDSGKDVSKMLECNRVHVQSNLSLVSSSKNSSTCKEFNNDLFDDYGGMASGSPFTDTRKAMCLGKETLRIEYITVQKASIKALHGWLAKFVVAEVEFYSRGTSSTPCYSNGLPPLVIVVIGWQQAIKHQDEYFKEKKDTLDNFRKRVDLEKEKHHNCVQETDRITLNGF